MKKRFQILFIAVACLAGLSPLSASAGAGDLLGIDPQGLYVGGQLGYTYGDVEGAWRKGLNNAARVVDNGLRGTMILNTNQEVATASSTTSGIAWDDSKLSYKLYAGYRFNRYFALEVAYADLGEYALEGDINTTATTTDGGTVRFEPLALDTEASYDTLMYSLLLHYPLSDSFVPFFRLGGASWEQDDRLSGRRTSGTSLLVGGGLDFQFSKRMSIRAEWERIIVREGQGGTPDINLATVGLKYNFGR